MAIDPKTAYPGQIDISDPTGYPGGKAQNITAPSAGDGTPWEELLTNDLFGFQQALLAAAAISPSGTPDKVGASDYLDALNALYKIIATTLGNSETVETNGSGLLISAAKKTGYNKDVGTIAGTVAAGDDIRFSALASGLSISNLLQIEDRKTSGTAPQVSVASTWTKRDLVSVILNNIGGAPLSSSQITLQAGSYWIEFDSPLGTNGGSIAYKARLRNITDASTDVLGTQAGDDPGAGGPGGDQSLGSGLVIIASAKVFELQYYATAAGDPLGVSMTTGEDNVYSRIRIYKVG